MPRRRSAPRLPSEKGTISSWVPWQTKTSRHRFTGETEALAAPKKCESSTAPPRVASGKLKAARIAGPPP
eukprot:CAMPEP_0172772622 /NCGR_PEP_ID=MMETSP1074-20121228/192709_1 /TAXON_ID=2916 /ORGANISM="Ceratium fusus, Strain PA161109" /LENGTH=69 /DNA_ID=CAMNT_0013608773 /DNA_START=193 /DNA_END=402 /DNA_ORIENTATION=+